MVPRRRAIQMFHVEQKAKMHGGHRLHDGRQAQRQHQRHDRDDRLAHRPGFDRIRDLRRCLSDENTFEFSMPSFRSMVSHLS